MEGAGFDGVGLARRVSTALSVEYCQYIDEGEGSRTKLKPSTSASSTHRSSSSAICSGVPTAVAPRPPTVMCWATVVLVHLATPGEALDQPSTADLLQSALHYITFL